MGGYKFDWGGRTLRLNQFIRNYQYLTAAFRGLPDFLVIGVAKGGTTSLYDYLRQHPQVASSYPRKEINFFERRFHRGMYWYRSNFPRRDPSKQFFEASPTYLYNPLVPERVQADFPNIKLVCLLRDPIARAFSHYQHIRRKGMDQAKDFETAVLRELRWIEAGDDVLSNEAFYKQAYLYQGFYAQHLSHWFKLFGQEQFLIQQSEQFYRDPHQVLNKIFDFVGVMPFEVPDLTPSNQGDYHQGMDEALVAQLQRFYAPHNQELYDLLGWDAVWDGKAGPR